MQSIDSLIRISIDWYDFSIKLNYSNMKQKKIHIEWDREIHTQLNDSLECNSVLKKFGYSLAKHIEFQKSQTKLAN